MLMTAYCHNAIVPYLGEQHRADRDHRGDQRLETAPAGLARRGTGMESEAALRAQLVNPNNLEIRGPSCIKIGKYFVEGP